MKTRILAIALILSIGLFFVSCEFLPDSEVTYTEAADTTNDSSAAAEATGITLNGSDWFEIHGSISSSSDADYYSVSVPAGTTYLELRVWYNDEKIDGGLLGISLFPMGFTEYNDNDETYLHLLAAGVKTNELHLTDISRIVLYVYGTTDYASGDYVLKFY